MVYIQHIPAPPLNRYIACLFYMEGWMPFRQEKIPPTPALNLQINLGDALQMYESDHRISPISLTESWLVGLYGVHHSIDWPADMRVYGVCFKPNCLKSIIKLSRWIISGVNGYLKFESNYSSHLRLSYASNPMAESTKANHYRCIRILHPHLCYSSPEDFVLSTKNDELQDMS